MSSLKDRINRLKGNPAKKESRTSANPEWDRIGARIVSNEWGEYVLREIRYPLTFAHGKYRLGELKDHVQALGVLCKSKEPQYDKMLYLDTETTGLGIGAGNVPFMIGIGFYERDAFVIQQLLMRNPSEEAALLHHLQRRILYSTHLISYNGKSFDWPILKNRYIINRFDMLCDLDHIDFLYPARSIWRYTLPTCRLGSVEEERLGIHRHEDIPGSLAPIYYFQYLSEGDPDILRGVFQHNEWDILTLASLSIHFAKTLQGDIDLVDMPLEENYRIVVWLEKIGLWTIAREILQEMISTRQDEIHSYICSIATLFKKRGELTTAVTLWNRAIECEGVRATLTIEPFIELAKYYEHHEKDYKKALAYAEEALLRIWKRASIVRSNGGLKKETIYEEIKHRIHRLQHKMNPDQTKLFQD